ncbi:MAG: EF-P lysine aminoacylase GenX [Gammaproteobacteria bacterium]|nr:EF-P lysine aminoacylase GenX [Gammaproteobacteria bacterium]
MSELWRPSCSIQLLKYRAQVFKKIREFFSERQVLEVDTPALMSCTVTDPYMNALSVELFEKSYFLQTSPEYAMKRLLASGCGDIYQLSKNYRADERGNNHQPEFTMLEWYRTGWGVTKLMDEVFALVNQISGLEQRQDVTYQQCFEQFLNVNPHTLLLDEAKELAEGRLGKLPEDLVLDDYLSLLFATQIEPNLGKEAVVFVRDFPASQAALAKLNDDAITAARFECYCEGIELANGFDELTDSSLQRERFKKDNQMRKQMGKPLIELDELFLQSLNSGLPNCSGVALGVDRLIMIATGKKDIRQVVPFAF